MEIVGDSYATSFSEVSIWVLPFGFIQNDVLSLRFGELTAVFDCICFAYF
jgi:hypothetical protein